MRKESLAPAVLVVVLGLVAVAGVDCTGGAVRPAGSSSAPSTSPPATLSPGPVDPAAVAAVCQDVSRIDQQVRPVLDRLQARTETKAQFQNDVLTVNDLSTRLYKDASGLVASDEHAFALMNELSTQLFHVIFGEDMLTDPSEVDRTSVTAAQEGLTGVDQAIRGGLLPCPSSG